MKHLFSLLLIFALASCGRSTEPKPYEPAFKPQFMVDAEDEQKKLNEINEKLSSKDPIIINEGKIALKDYLKDKKNFDRFLSILKSTDSVNYELQVKKVVESRLTSILKDHPEDLKKVLKLAKKDKSKFLELCKNAGIIPKGFEVYFEDYNPNVKDAVEKKKGNRKGTE